MQKNNNTERINLPLQVIYLLGLILVVSISYSYPIQNNNKLFGFYLLSFSLLLSLNIVPFFIWFARKIKFMDNPQERKFHSVPTPLLGGVAVFISLIATIIIFRNHINMSPVLQKIFLMSSVILILGVIDDKFDLPSWTRLIVQFISAGIVIYYGARLSFLPNNAYGYTLEVILSLLWIVGITNAINFLDGMDGLATGYIVITASILGVVAYQLVMPEYLYVLLAIVGASAGFIPFNFRFGKSALIFLGDSGATFLGFLMGSLTIEGKWGSQNDVFHSKNEVGVIIPLLVLGVAIFNIIFTIIMRFSEGNIKSFSDIFSYAGKDHFHHRLYVFGFRDKTTVFIIFLITICLGLGSIVLRNARKVDAFLILLQSIIIFILIGFFLIFVEHKYINKQKHLKAEKKTQSK